MPHPDLINFVRVGNVTVLLGADKRLDSQCDGPHPSWPTRNFRTLVGHTEDRQEVSIWPKGDGDVRCGLQIGRDGEIIGLPKFPRTWGELVSMLEQHNAAIS